MKCLRQHRMNRVTLIDGLLTITNQSSLSAIFDLLHCRVDRNVNQLSHCSSNYSCIDFLKVKNLTSKVAKMSSLGWKKGQTQFIIRVFIMRIEENSSSICIKANAKCFGVMRFSFDPKIDCVSASNRFELLASPFAHCVEAFVCDGICCGIFSYHNLSINI